MTQTDIIRAFDTLPVKERLIVAKKIQLRMVDELFEDLDRDFPDTVISPEEIQKEITTYRNARKRKD